MGKLKDGKFLLIVAFAMFTCLYLITSGNYYEYQVREKTNLTEESIKQFEKDVSEGKNVDINDYLENTNKDLNNKLSNLNKDISNKISSAFGSSIKYIFESIGKAISD